MNVNLFISIFFNLSDGNNITTTTSLADNKNVPAINVLIGANTSETNWSNYANVAEVTATYYKNASEVTRFDGENVFKVTATDNKNITKVNASNDEKASEVTRYDGENVFEVTATDNKNITKVTASNDEKASEVTRYDGENVFEVTATDNKNITKVTAFDDENTTKVAFDSEKIRALSAQLYSDIVGGKYDDAITMSMSFDDKVIVTTTVKNLIDTNANNTMNYAYRLWTAGGKDIVTESFPPEFKAILNGDPVTIVSKDCGSVLSLPADFQEQRKPRLAFRDKVTTSWKMIPIWEDGNSPVLYFKIKNVDTNLYLYVNWLDLGDGLRGVWADKDAYTEEHHWYLKPEAKNVFKIINRKYAVSLSFNNSLKNSALGEWVWVSDEGNCKRQHDACSWSYEWLIEPLLK